MRFALLGFVLVIGGMIGVSAVDSISKMQDAKLERFCKQIPVGASYDDVCAEYR
ncbi:hypothetical protein BOW92_gp190 [Synechococcus phage S-WAM1]|jgi:hypothetical protein|uniref:Uncharacterized protein n=1 Tax=Synechococcus phage S-WAM1 TaxID=1815521 RepID=A0A1D8KSH6_9CAUD|nr:hypothetical protein BOW92_gp190 [Synechococcus phage S-WAM1]AOV61527.1 hypothetical protein P090810_054 [Synechococcus phage S-WAM1]